MAGILEFLDGAMTNKLRTLMESREHERIDRQCKQRDGNSKKEQKGILQMKNTVKEMKTAFDGLFIDQAWLETISELEDISIETTSAPFSPPTPPPSLNANWRKTV